MGSTLALAHPLYYNRLVQLASTIKFVHSSTSSKRRAAQARDWWAAGETEGGDKPGAQVPDGGDDCCDYSVVYCGDVSADGCSGSGIWGSFLNAWGV